MGTLFIKNKKEIINLDQLEILSTKNFLKKKKMLYTFIKFKNHGKI